MTNKFINLKYQFLYPGAIYAIIQQIIFIRLLSTGFTGANKLHIYENLPGIYIWCIP